MTRPLICATVADTRLEALCEARDAASAAADLVEVRLDRLERPDVAGALADRRGPVLATCRPAWEGGGFTGSEAERFALLEDALRRGAEYVDVEWRAGERARTLVERRNGRGVVLSFHDFEGVPGDLEGVAAAMCASGAEVVKLAVTARRLADTLPLLALGRRLGRQHALALVAMGNAGVATRILAAHFGSCWTYAGDGVAPGQIPLRDLLDTYAFRAITPSTAVYGILGRPLGHSVSPAMHNAAFRARGLDAVYVPFEAEGVEDFRLVALGLDVRGASVTAPFKADVVPYLAKADPATRQAGAANTIRVRGDNWEGRNTDVEGFLDPLRGVALDGLRVALVGAGGAARAVAAALAGTGARVTVHARRRDAAAAVAAIAGGRAGDGSPRTGEWDLLVNATPVGTHPHSGVLPVDRSALPGGRLVYDLVYNPPVTALRRAAGAVGCATLGGLDMLLAQAARQFEWWTGAEAPTDRMRAAAEQALLKNE